jgi:hypothetical protein
MTASEPVREDFGGWSESKFRGDVHRALAT